MGPFTLYLGVLVASLGESSAFVGLLVPGVGVVLAAGVAAARGAADPLWVGALASIGSVTGFWVSYHLGGVGGPRIGRWNRRAEGALMRAKSFFDRYGAWSVFWGHFFGPVRALVPFAAGAAGLPPRRFWPASVLGGVLWGYGLTLGGALLSGGWTLLEARLGRASFVVALLAALLYLSLRFASGAVLLGLRLLTPLAEAAGRWLGRAQASRRLAALILSRPGLGRWLARRLAPDRATGLVLTVGALACAASAWVFFGVVEDLLFHDPLVQVDRNVFHLLQSVRTPAMDRLFLAVTQLGGAPVVLTALAAAALALWALSRRFETGLLLASFAAGEALTWLIKEVAGRARPSPALPLVVETSGAFPSNHSFSALALYGFLAYLAGRGLRSPRLRADAFALAGVLIAAVGLSRLYLGVHWLSDVAAGYALAGVWLGAVVTSEEIRLRYGRPRPDVGTRRGRLAAAAVAAVALVVWGGEAHRAWTRVQEPAPRSTPVVLVPPSRLPSEARRLADVPVEALLGTPLGRPQAVLVGDSAAFAAAAGKTGWRPTRPVGVLSLLARGAALLQGRVEPEGPVAPVFWRGSPQDLSLARPEGSGRRVVCLWHTGERVPAAGEVWIAFERVRPAARRLLGIPLPVSPRTARESLFAPALAAGGSFREVPLEGNSPSLAVPVPE